MRMCGCCTTADLRSQAYTNQPVQHGVINQVGLELVQADWEKAMHDTSSSVSMPCAELPAAVRCLVNGILGKCFKPLQGLQLQLGRLHAQAGLPGWHLYCKYK